MAYPHAALAKQLWQLTETMTGVSYLSDHDELQVHPNVASERVSAG
jgi:hypothetical protein